MGDHENKLYSYKMARATGFAPNPYFGVLTLATCKADLRQVIRSDDWMAGWTSKSLAKCHDNPGEERLVYLARVTRKLTYADYWAQHPEKRPDLSDKKADARHGDNIYEPSPTQPGAFIMHANSHRISEEKQAKDLRGQYVLVCEEFYYFSPASPLEVPAPIRPCIPKGQIKYGKITEDASPFIDFVRENAAKCMKTSYIKSK